ncbi:MAG TPA: DUF262 domain-containing protein, partial [Gammaproteobacteria bacterium]|nr:DUF262 domain-containing protein [Gammaproteobacteria bacterium]
MKDASICLKPINDLLTDEQGQPTQFWIPAYQRGYRWTPLQVTQLLDDVWEFIQGSEEGSRQAFYCLQPLVLKAREEGDFEVVDGQQRLTTIYILLTYMKDIVALLGKSRFQIRFETRGEANEPFLDNIDLDRAEENVDFYYICKAYQAIDDWFSGRDSSHKLKLLQHLLNDDEAGRNVKVIWFELADSDNPVDAFTRLNVGKIPLTNDELIRALFLKRSGADKDEAVASQLKIAYEWDQLEKALQADAFWYFLSNKAGARQNRISFLFELITKTDGSPDSAGYGEYRIFYEYNKKLKEEGVAHEHEWLKIKQTYMTLEEWFEDRRLYHIIGFLIQQGLGVDKIQALSKQATKSHFEQKLREKIYTQVIGGNALSELSEEEVREHVSETLDDLEYGVDSKEIRSILLLFNLATLLEDPRSNIRFQFDSFKNGDWDIEHVRSVASSRPVRHNERVKWLKLCLGYLQAQNVEAELRTEMETYIKMSQAEADTVDFDVLYERVLACFKESDDE